MENNYVTNIDGMNLWINGNNWGGLEKYINHLCIPNCELVQWGVGNLPHMCFFAKKKMNSGMEFSCDYKWELVSGLVGTVCMCGSDNCDRQIEKKERGGKKVS
jgi:SET domain-containing protein